MSEEKKCDWENCPEPAVHRARWQRETGGLKNEVVYDYADYCDGHTLMASAYGAVRTETYEQV